MPVSRAATREYGTGVGSLDGWRYCPRCGRSLRRVENRVECDACGLRHYARSELGASAFVVDDGRRILLARRAHEPDAGLWDAPGGFIEEGEDPLSGLSRELREETGLEIEVGDFVGAFMDRYGDGPEASSVLNLVWEATIAAGDASPADDVSELRWFSRDALPSDEELAFHWLATALGAWSARR
jgi:8-oxo-dGTP diphosphatase